jgi:GT2 family glycosyltransferase
VSEKFSNHKPLVSVVIVNWNGAIYLPDCLDTVTAQTFTDYEVIVVDNASNDHSADNIEVKWPGVRVERLDKNIGFAAANNLGARIARGSWLALLNNDTFPASEWIARLLDAANRNPQFSFFASCLVQFETEGRIDSAGDIYHVSGHAWHRDGNRLLDEVHHKEEEVFSPCAAAALYNRDEFLEVGGFAERFSSHHEDVDIGFRLRLHGARCLYVPGAVVEHVGSASYGKESDVTVYHVQRNLVWSFVENMPGHLLWKYLPAHLVANFVFLIYYSMRGKWRIIWRAKIDALLGMRKSLRVRRTIQEKRKVGISELTMVMDHGWFSPYLLGKRSEKIRKVVARLGLDQQ